MKASKLIRNTVIMGLVFTMLFLTTACTVSPAKAENIIRDLASSNFANVTSFSAETTITTTRKSTDPNEEQRVFVEKQALFIARKNRQMQTSMHSERSRFFFHFDIPMDEFYENYFDYNHNFFFGGQSYRYEKMAGLATRNIEGIEYADFRQRYQFEFERVVRAYDFSLLRNYYTSTEKGKTTVELELYRDDYDNFFSYFVASFYKSWELAGNVNQAFTTITSVDAYYIIEGGKVTERVFTFAGKHGSGEPDDSTIMEYKTVFKYKNIEPQVPSSELFPGI